MHTYWKHLQIHVPHVSIIEAGHQSFSPQQINHYIVKQNLIIHAVTAGKGIFKVNGKTYHLSKNDGFILRKNQRVYYAPDSKDPWTTIWLGLSGDDLDNILNNTQLISQSVIQYNPKQKSLSLLKEIVEYIEKNSTENKKHALKTFSLLYNFLFELNNEFFSTDNINNFYHMNEDELASLVYEYIYNNFSEKIEIDKIAKHFNINRNYLFNLCKNHFGQSPKQILQELRMNKASQYIRGSDLSIKEIAAKIGYNDPLHFSKMFKKYYHYSPTQFRKLSDTEINEALFIRKLL